MRLPLHTRGPYAATPLTNAPTRASRRFPRADRKVLVQLTSEGGEKAGPPLELPLNVTSEQLQLLTNTLLAEVRLADGRRSRLAAETRLASPRPRTSASEGQGAFGLIFLFMNWEAVFRPTLLLSGRSIFLSRASASTFISLPSKPRLSLFPCGFL